MPLPLPSHFFFFLHAFFSKRSSRSSQRHFRARSRFYFSGANGIVTQRCLFSLSPSAFASEKKSTTEKNYYRERVVCAFFPKELYCDVHRIRASKQYRFAIAVVRFAQNFENFISGDIFSRNDIRCKQTCSTADKLSEALFVEHSCDFSVDILYRFFQNDRFWFRPCK